MTRSEDPDPKNRPTQEAAHPVTTAPFHRAEDGRYVPVEEPAEASVGELQASGLLY